MAKIDTSTITGYADMSPEEKVKALEALEYEDNTSELERYKNAVTKANKEAAEWKKKHNELLSEEDRKKAERDEEVQAMREELDNLRKDRKKSEYKAKFIAEGYEEALAEESAEALLDGDYEKFFAQHKKFLDAHDNNVKAGLIGQRFDPPAGGNGEGGLMTKEKFAKLSPKERFEFSEQHPEEYKQMYGGN